ncbi:GNAT family N-acetyltransferase [Pontibacter sp. G13]|uniref:GNAT family N-acetyltransferase n=1 Tax=Pontibacter sp. G13 TaxID=3074898 RepID=UPI002889806C|nr:GNAT family N-acetyltransferase [Pontibacter sp. G13]WNJ17669.1 GNAT family N-acetyltransferase [Pontibacter sp. G13]
MSHPQFQEEMLTRPLALSDEQGLLDLVQINRERIRRYFPLTVEQISNPASTQRFLLQCQARQQRKEQYIFVIEDPAKKRLAGMLYIKNIEWRVPKCELAYFIDGDYEGMGLTSEAIGGLSQFAFDQLGMEKLYVRVDPANLGSCRVAEKNGFELEGILRKEFRTPDGDLVDIAYFGKIRHAR